MTFSEALRKLKEGNKIARSGWNGKDMFLVLVPAEAWDVQYDVLNYTFDDFPKFPQTAPWIGMKTADNKFVPWLASQTDILADDWLIVQR